MARDHRKLRVFHEAHRQVLVIYKETKGFPKEEWFGVRMQMRRAAVSVASNLVEGNARRTTKDYCKFLHISRASASEVEYLTQLSHELGYFTDAVYEKLREQWAQLLPQLESLVQSMEALLEEERKASKRDFRLETTD